MRNLLIVLLALIPAFAFMSSCKRHTRIIEIHDGPAGEDGQNGQDGTDGIDGLNGLSFDYVRGMDGATICEGALVIPAQYVVPASILALAPAEDPHNPNGLTLTFGTTDSPIRFYLGSMLAGEFCLVEKIHGEGWVAVGDPLIFPEPGFIVIVPPIMIPLVDPSVLNFGVIVEFPGECNTLNYSRNHLRIGSDIRINFNRGVLRSVLAPQQSAKHSLTVAQIRGTQKALDRRSNRIVERRVFVHKPNHSKGGGRGGKSSCFTFLGNARWRVTEDYVLDATSRSFGTSITDSFETWDAEVSFNVFGMEDISATVDGPDTVSPDGKNEIMFGIVESPGAIAVSIVWGIFSGPPSQRRIVEYDVIFDDVDFAWATTGSPGVMDVQNIATHEFGHCLGLGDIYDSTCSEETMYGFAVGGETKKRDLNSGDITGVRKLY